MNSDTSVTAGFAAKSVSTSAPEAGSYSGTTSQSGAVSFYVSPDATHVQDVVVRTGPECSPAKSFGGDEVSFPSITINPDGSFSATTTQTGLAFNVPAQFTYAFSGHFAGTDAAGQVREDVTSADGTSFTCTTNLQTWSAERDTQGSQAASPPPPGSYSGVSSQSGAVSFYVSPDATHVQDVVVRTGPECSPAKSFGGDEVSFPSITINPDGSFSATTTQTGDAFNVPAQFTFTFQGHFHGQAQNGGERAAGQFREDITFNNGTSFTCTTNLGTWTALGP